MGKILLALMISLVSLSTIASELVSECASYYKEADTIIIPMALNTAKARSDFEVFKKQYDAYKQQLAMLPAEQQKITCIELMKRLDRVKETQAKATTKK